MTDDGIHGAWKDLTESAAGRTPIVELEEEESVSASSVQVFDMLSESEFPEAEESFEPDQVMTDELASAQPVAEAPELTLGVETFEPPTLLTTPGRNLFPSPVFALVPSTQETDDALTARGFGVLSAADTFAEPTDGASQFKAAGESAQAAEPKREMSAEEIPSVEAVEPIAIPETHAVEIGAPQFGALRVELPSAIEVANAPAEFSNVAPTEIVSGETFAPIQKSAQTVAETFSPPANVNQDEQIVLTTDAAREN